MILEIKIGGASSTIQIADPFRCDLNDVICRIAKFAEEQVADISSFDFRWLVQGMIRGIVGCERGCPADAKDFISRGHSVFRLQYVEGGILTARAATPDGRQLHVKMFPDF